RPGPGGLRVAVCTGLRGAHRQSQHRGLAADRQRRRVRATPVDVAAAGSGPVSFLLDTNVVSELRKRPDVVDPNVRTWAQRHPARDLYISVVTVLEIELGVSLIERPDPRPERDAYIAATADVHGLTVVTR